MENERDGRVGRVIQAGRQMLTVRLKVEVST